MEILPLDANSHLAFTNALALNSTNPSNRQPICSNFFLSLAAIDAVIVLFSLSAALLISGSMVTDEKISLGMGAVGIIKAGSPSEASSMLPSLSSPLASFAKGSVLFSATSSATGSTFASVTVSALSSTVAATIASLVAWLTSCATTSFAEGSGLSSATSSTTGSTFASASATASALFSTFAATITSLVAVLTSSANTILVEGSGLSSAAATIVSV